MIKKDKSMSTTEEDSKKSIDNSPFENLNRV